MLVCAKCGTNNPDENKYCRECGERLGHPTDNAAEDQLELKVDTPARQSAAGPQTPANVNVAVGELLYQTFQLYESAKLDEAMAKCKEALRLNPESTSGHSLLGMIYERKSDLAAADGRDEVAKDYLFSALRQHERVAEMNPDSMADAEKLRELRRKMRRLWDTPRETMTLGQVWELSLQVLREVPKPVFAAGGVGFLVLAALLLIWSRSGQPVQRIQPNTLTDTLRSSQAELMQTPVQSQPAYPPAPVGTVPEPQFTAPQPGVMEPAVQPEPVQEAPAVQAQVVQPEEPHGPVVPPPVRITPKKLPVLPGIQPTPSSVQPRISEPVTAPPAPAGPKWRGSYLQMQGMELARQGKTQDAIAAFKRAIEAYQEQIKAGDEVDSANAGIRTCRHYIEMLESS